MLHSSPHFCELHIVRKFFKKQMVKHFAPRAAEHGLGSAGQCSEATGGFQTGKEISIWIKHLGRRA